MAKKRSEPKATSKPKVVPRCFRCDGTGMICNSCGESEAVCQGDCRDPEEWDGHGECDDCGGTGTTKGEAKS